MDPKKDILYPILVATGYFVSIFFAAVVLVPASIALAVAVIIAVIAVLWLRWLQAIGMDEWGAPMGMLIVLPLLCVFLGILWWIADLLGIWKLLAGG